MEKHAHVTRLAAVINYSLISVWLYNLPRIAVAITNGNILMIDKHKTSHDGSKNFYI